MVLSPVRKIEDMGYKLKKNIQVLQSVLRKRVLLLSLEVPIETIFYLNNLQKRKRHNRGLNKLTGNVLKVVQKLTR